MLIKLIFLIGEWKTKVYTTFFFLPDPSLELKSTTSFEWFEAHTFLIMRSSVEVDGLAPNKKMKHVIISGFIGAVLSTVGSLAMWDQAIPLYNSAINFICLPSAWLDRQLFLNNQIHGKTHN